MAVDAMASDGRLLPRFVADTYTRHRRWVGVGFGVLPYGKESRRRGGSSATDPAYERNERNEAEDGVEHQERDELAALHGVACAADRQQPAADEVEQNTSNGRGWEETVARQKERQDNAAAADP